MDVIIVILVGAVAGWLASKILRLETSALMNILLGVAGSMLGNYLLGFVPFSFGAGVIGDVLVAFLGAVILVFAYKIISK